MLCLINILTRIVTAYFFAILVAVQFSVSIVVIYYGVKIQDELSILSFSSVLSKQIQSVSSIAAVTSGSVSLAMSILAVIMLTPVARKWIYHIYQPITLVAFAVMISTGLYLIYAGNTGA
jgi:hypothetical protein